MSTLTNVNSNARSMNGISIISANEIYSDNLVVSGLTLTSGLSATPAQVIDFANNAPIMSGEEIKPNTIPDTALSSNVPLKNALNIFTGPNYFENGDIIFAKELIGNTPLRYILFDSTSGKFGFYNNPTSSYNWSIDYLGNIVSAGGLDLSGNITSTGNNTYTGLNQFLTKYDSTTVNLSNSVYCSNYAYTGVGLGPSQYNTFIGKDICMYQNATNTIQNNVFIGQNIAQGGTFIRYNIAIGNNALQSLTSGNGNQAFGLNALQSLSIGDVNFAFGNQSMVNFTSGSYNFCMGTANGANMGSGSYNLLMGGANICYANNIPPNTTTCNYNIALGYSALTNVITNTTLTNNVAVGCNSLNGNGGSGTYYGLQGSYNAGLGDKSGYSLTNTSSYNTFLGALTDVPNIANTYNYCTIIGYGSGSNLTGSNQIILGRSTETTKIAGALNVSGASTFSTAPTMSGANISSASIPESALPSTIVKLSTANIFTNTNTFNMATTYRDGATSSLRPTYQNPLWFVYPKVGYSTNRRYYYRPQGSSTGSDVITFDVDTPVKYYMMGGGGGGAGNVSTNILGGGGGGAGQLLVGSFTALAGITYTLTTDAHTGTGSNGNATSVLAGTTGGSVSITGTGLSLVASGGIGGSAHTSTAPAGRGGNSGSGALGGNGATTTGTAGLVGASQGGGAGGSFNFATSALGNTFTLTMTDFTVLTFKGGDGGGNNATSGLDGTLYGCGGSGGGGTSTQKGGNGVQGFILLEVVPYTQETYLFNPTYGITSNVYENSRLIATTEYVKNQYYLNNTFSNLLQVNVPSTISPTTSTTGVNGAIQVICNNNTTSVARDGMGFKAGIDTNNIINFANTAGTLRGSISGTSATVVAYNTSSDERLKENIVNMPSQLENIKLLSSRNFNWKLNGESDNGFIAQEIYRVYPELNPLKNNDTYEDKLYPVKSDGTDFIHLIDYGKMTPYLWSAVQELTLIVERQQKQIDDILKSLNV